MIIKSIKLNNFRVYLGLNTVIFEGKKDKNITIISANNGYGKTTFLTSLIWAFYGKHMVSVEQKYRRDVASAGGYSSYLKTLVNRDIMGKSNESVFVEVVIDEINNPSIPFQSATIIRSINTQEWSDNLTILIDGHSSELTMDIGNDVFINDFILPREIAKFFFFDAEKIVSLAEAKSVSELRQLGVAYSEVLGISKFEDLLVSLNNTLLKISKDGTDKNLPLHFERVNSVKQQLEEEIAFATEAIESAEQSNSQLELLLNEIRESLYREGSKNSREKLDLIAKSVQINKLDLEENSKKIKEYLDYIPFLILGDGYTSFVNAVINMSSVQLDDEVYNSVVDRIKEDIVKLLETSGLLTSKIKEEVLNLRAERAASTLISEMISLDALERDHILGTYHFIDKHLKMELASLFAKDVELRQSIFSYSSILKNSETNELNPIVQKLHEERQRLHFQVQTNLDLIKVNTEKLGGLKTNLNVTLRTHSLLYKELTANSKDYKKVEIITRMIERIRMLISELHQRKKDNLEFAILSGINKLMHKDGFVSKVVLSTANGIFNVNLYDQNGIMIEKNDLSKGEQQLYATALLTALVEESGIQFPVFIDSPLQKFDKAHTMNVISQFYPKISKQVVLFPLLEKELTKQEFDVMKQYVSSAFRVDNSKGGSKIKEVSIHSLFLA